MVVRVIAVSSCSWSSGMPEAESIFVAAGTKGCVTSRQTFGCYVLWDTGDHTYMDHKMVGPLGVLDQLAEI